MLRNWQFTTYIKYVVCCGLWVITAPCTYWRITVHLVSVVTARAIWGHFWILGMQHCMQLWLPSAHTTPCLSTCAAGGCQLSACKPKGTCSVSVISSLRSPEPCNSSSLNYYQFGMEVMGKNLQIPRHKIVVMVLAAGSLLPGRREDTKTGSICNPLLNKEMWLLMGGLIIFLLLTSGHIIDIWSLENSSRLSTKAKIWYKEYLSS